MADGEATPEDQDKRKRVFLSYAKHSAVRDELKLEELEMSYVLKRLMECDEPIFVLEVAFVRVLRRDLDRLFGRI